MFKNLLPTVLVLLCCFVFFQPGVPTATAAPIPQEPPPWVPDPFELTMMDFDLTVGTFGPLFCADDGDDAFVTGIATAVLDNSQDLELWLKSPQGAFQQVSHELDYRLFITDQTDGLLGRSICGIPVRDGWELGLKAGVNLVDMRFYIVGYKF